MPLIIAFVFLSFLISCVPNPDNQPNLHEISLYKQNNGIRYSYFYGSPNKAKIGDAPIELQESSQNQQVDVFSVSNALYANGKPYLKRSLIPQKAPFKAHRYRYSSDILLNTKEPLEKVLYFDGELWFTLLEDSSLAVNSQIVPQERIGGLGGVGKLTQREADMLERYFASIGESVVVALLSENNLPTQSLSGFNEYRHTVFYVQEGLILEEEGFSAQVQGLRWDFLGLGDKALAEDGLSFVLTSQEGTFNSVWNEAHAGELNLPQKPVVDFSRESVLGIFLGVKNELGHGVDVNNVTLEDGEVYADVNIIEPASLIRNEAHVSPWLMIRIFRPSVEVVWIRSAQTGDLVGIARSK